MILTMYRGAFIWKWAFIRSCTVSQLEVAIGHQMYILIILINIFLIDC